MFVMLCYVIVWDTAGYTPGVDEVVVCTLKVLRRQCWLLMVVHSAIYIRYDLFIRMLSWIGRGGLDSREGANSE